jgi:TDG/mug DNA glycosylase family protein
MIEYHLSADMQILFVGINPHPGSAARGVPFSNNKIFWYHLQAAGLLREEKSLLRNDTYLQTLYAQRFNQHYKFGLINLIDRPTSSTAALKKHEADPGRERLLKVIEQYKPRIVCFVGKITYQLFAQKKNCTHGWQEMIGHSQVYVMHTPLRGPSAVRIAELQEMQHFLSSSLAT